MMFQTIQILCTVLILTAVYRSYNKEKKSRQCAMVFLCFLVACCSNSILQRIPMPTEELTIRALGERNEEAKADEIVFRGFVLEGEEYNKIEILEGKWFWSGENYMWRNETDTRQPEGTTREITVAIPMGTHREAVFTVDQWRGKAEIQYGDHIQVLDFGPGNATNVEIPDSNLSTLRLVKFFRLLGYLGSIFIFLHVSKSVEKKYAQNPLKYQHKLVEHQFMFTIFGICFLQLLFFIRYAGVDGFWYDEACQISFSIGGDHLFDNLTPDLIPMPLATLVNRIIYYTMPYGEKWLLLPYCIATVIGTYYTGLTAKHIYNDTVGVVATVILCFSANLAIQSAFEARSYGFYYMSSAILAYLYVKRLDHLGQETKKDIVYLSICMIFFAQMHYIAIPFCIGLGIFDLVLYLQKKIKLQCCIPYLLAASTYVPFIPKLYRDVFEANSWVIVDSFHPKVNLQTVDHFIKYVFSSNAFLYHMFLFGTTCLVYEIYQEKKINKKLHYFFLMYAPTFLISIMFIYGAFINQNATLWENRYFVFLFPYLVTIAAFGFVQIFQVLLPQKEHKNLMVHLLACTFIAGQSLITAPASVTAIRQPWREAANYLYTQANYIYNDTTMVYATGSQTPMLGWNEYYFTQQGRRDAINVGSQRDISISHLSTFNRVYIFYGHNSFNDNYKKIIEEEFELIENNTSLKIMTYVRK